MRLRPDDGGEAGGQQGHAQQEEEQVRKGRLQHVTSARARTQDANISALLSETVQYQDIRVMEVE